MRGFLFLLLVMCKFALSGQILDNSTGVLFSEDPKFNSTFIKKNKIKSIKGYYSTKADYDRIRPTNNVYVYEFNKVGFLIQDYKTTRRDTVVRSYNYNADNRLSVMRRSDQFGFHSYHYKYDSLGRLVEKEYRRDKNLNGSKISFDLNKSYSVSTERYTYDQQRGQLKTNYYNSFGKLYRVAYAYSDSNGYLYKEEFRSINGNSRSETAYTYNQNGFLKEKTSEKQLAKKITTRIIFEYDALNNIMAQHYYRNSVYKTDFQIVYDSSTMLLSALLARDIETNVITILKFSDYRYFS